MVILAKEKECGVYQKGVSGVEQVGEDSGGDMAGIETGRYHLLV